MTEKDIAENQKILKTLSTQVGGHKFSHEKQGNQKFGMLDVGNGHVLKSLQNPPRGDRELNFYLAVFDQNCTDPILLEARQFLPPFFGTREKDGVKFIELENLTNGFYFPCVADLKMGQVTYDEEATAEKIAHEEQKYPPLKNLGFQFVGMMRHDAKTKKREVYDKVYCRSLTEESMVTDGLGCFFGLQAGDLRHDVILPLLCKLRKLESWFLRQKKFSFIASSLLIVYEGLRNSREMNKPESRKSENFTEDNVLTGSDQDNKTSVICLNNIHPKKESSSSVVKETNTNSQNNRAAQKRPSESTKEKEPTKKIKVSETAEDERSVEGRTSNKGDLEGKDGSEPQFGLHLIDFAHTFPAKDIDYNFLFGLQKLINFLEKLSHMKI